LKRAGFYLISGAVLLVIFDLFLFLDYIILDDIFHIAILIRLGIVSPIIVLYIGFYYNIKSPRMKDAGKILITLLLGLSIVFFVAISHSRESLFYFSEIILVVIFGNTFLRMPFFHALVSSLIIFFAYVFFFPIDFHLPGEVRISQSVFLLTGILITLFANVSLDFNARKRFSLSLRERIHRQILLRKNIHLAELSSIDPLTGLANRREVDNYLSNLKQMRPEILSIIMLDIDYFKQYNDLYGHSSGDACLQKVAAILAGSVHRKRDLVGRYGGEEFIIILPETSLADTLMISRRILADLEKAALPNEKSPVSQIVTLSAGAACGEVAVTGDVDAILKTADDCLYKAKEKGRNQVCGLDMVNPIIVNEEAPGPGDLSG
jgi:diguanylate cyclase (GGDEF)-like protein